ncbi:hypothetical protein GE061_016348 [Apolygus lucorum]|uniref:C2 domain-containing protein n=1 Tax=Apolygus lucorum TaxID=248454 RepID=A0A6A4K566_APOLU|nr:hypothetical protein GE061_016348 [Apolygus lucorum]
MAATCMLYDQRLKGDLRSLGRKEALCIGTDEVDNHPPVLGGRACSRCRGELGRIINRGANCPSCNQRVCKSCRHYDTNRWLCLVCFKQLEQLSGSTAGTDRNANVNSERVADRGDLINSNIQRSCSFSDVDPPSWSFLRCSPDMRAYSSMPRNRILDYSVRIRQDERITPESNYDPILRLFPRTPVNGNSPESQAKHSLETSKAEVLDDLSPLSSTPVTSPEQSPVVDKRDIASITSTSSFIRNLSFRKREAGHSWYIPPGVTPPRSRRRLNTGDSHDEDMATLDKGLTPESDDYKLVFISSSDSSSREELQSDDASSTSSGRVGLLDDADWDYFECWPCMKRETPECGSVGLDRPQPPGDINSCPATVGPCVPIVPIHVPIPVPFPFPVPFFVPVPVPSSLFGSYGHAMTSQVLPDSEVLPLDEVLCHKAVSPVLVRDPEENSVVLKVYKSLDDTDHAVSPTPEDILRLTEARLKDFTDIKDDNSVSSVSSDDDNRLPSTRTYKLNHSDNSSCEFSIAASPPKSLTSSSDDTSDDDDDKPRKKTFSRTFILHESSSEMSDEEKSYELLENESGDNEVNDLCSDVTDVSLSTNHENLVHQKTGKDLFSKSEPILSDIDVNVTTKEDNLDESHSELSLLQVDNEPLETSVEVINSIITFSHDEVVQILSEFLSAERSLYGVCGNSKMNLKNCQTEVDAAMPETRSNTSDEFSGTESMEMPLEDSLECGGSVEGARGRESGSSARFTSLVMITQEQGGNPSPPMEGKVTVVTGSSSVVCLEEGLADDDSWVEDLDRDDVVTTTEESSEDEPYPDREEELRGYHRSAIDFTLHTIAEESCEESEVEGEKDRPTELEKYFFYGLSDNLGNIEDGEDAMSETSSIFSEGVESTVSAGVEETQSLEPVDLASSRLEKYFLSGFMGFRRDSDGSVGSDSEGRPSPEQRRKRLVRARGTGRQHSNSLDNLVESSEQAEIQVESEGSSTETDSHDELSSFDKGDGQFDTVKRTKKKKRSVPSCPNDLLEAPEVSPNIDEHSDDGDKTPQPEPQPSDLLSSRTKQQSRDSGFVGSCDDLLKETRESNDSPIAEELPSTTQTPQNDQNSNCPPSAGLIRKDSFNNWSSDEETNLMMSKMRAFFKTMVAAQPKTTTAGANSPKPKTKPPQLVYFENELTRLMKTVPGLRDEQVREIVEYLSSEDTWSDSYDSSDYTSSDLENSTKRSALQEEISASCRQIISNFETSCDDFGIEDETKDSAFVYSRLVASFNKMEVPKKENVQNSPLLIEKVMQHIGTRLWALMHEVSGGEGSSPRTGRYHKRLSSKISASTTEEEEDSVEDYCPLPRSKSHDPLLEENRQEASDNERFSWRGSFESALMASDSRTRLASGGESSASALALAAKRRSAGDLMFKSCSREQLDRVRSCGSIGGSAEDKIWTREQKRRRSSVPDSGGSAGDDDSEEEAGSRATLPRSLQSSCASATNSLPRLPLAPSASGAPIYKSHSVHQFNVKSARYRPPGYRNSPLAPPPRRDRNKRNTSSNSGTGCDDASICSDPVVRDEEVGEDLLTHRASLGARSDSMASVYSGAGEGRHGRVAVKGEVQFGLQYNYKLSSLEIRVQCCRDLAAVDTKRNRSDPYVKVYLLPDKSKTGKRKTKVKKHTLNPVFDDILRFQVDIKDLELRTLWLTVWHSDMFGRNDFLGEVLMPLENKIFDDPHPKYYTLQERSETLEELSSKGELIVGLKFDPPEETSSSSKKRPSKGTLYVLVKEAKNLPAVKTNGTSDPFCKSYLLPDKSRSTKQKAPVVKKTCNPAWNHTFTYNNVSIDELADRSLELTLWDHDRLASNEFLGGVRLNLSSGKCDGKPVEWMDSSGNEVTLWQRMIERPKFWVEGCLPLRPSLGRRSHDL